MFDFIRKRRRNVKLLIKAAERIEQIPESYDQTTFCRPSNESPCKTAACLAGEIIICSQPSIEQGLELLVTHTKDGFYGTLFLGKKTASELAGEQGWVYIL